jgi:hypothetical protein
MSDETYTAAEMADLLDAYWQKTGEWDPWTNGEMDAELRDLDPKDPKQMAERRRIVDDRSFAHDVIVGQRIAVGRISRAIRDGRFRELMETNWAPTFKEQIDATR